MFLGTWPIVLAVLESLKHNEDACRSPQHRYFNFSITNFLAAVLVALTPSADQRRHTEIPSFLTELTQVNIGAEIILAKKD